MNKIAFITGASSGIGEATATEFAKQGYHIIITGRRKAKLENLAIRLSEYPIKVLPLVFDIQSRSQTELIFKNIPEEWKNIDVLINNAGLAAGLDPIDKGNIDDWEQMIDTNIKGLLYITRLVSPGMVERQKGHIINIGSVAGKEVYANGNVYCATKFAVDALTRGMRIDLARYGIKVASVCPGLVETEFSMVRFKGDESKAKPVYEGICPLKGEDIANIIWFMVSQPAHVNLADVLVFPTAQAAAAITFRT